jgi:hypothetical protein
VKVYKLLRQRKDGSLGPLFIGKSERIEFNEWLTSKEIPTKGYSFRPGWHTTNKPKAPHLTENGRVWVEAEIKDFYTLKRPKNQGGEWFISKQIKVLRILNKNDIQLLNNG